MGASSTAAGVLQSVNRGPAWHGDSVLALLEDVCAGEASARPVPGVHTIWELVLHINAWQDFAIEVLEGGSTALLDGEANFPPVTETSEDAWKSAVSTLSETGDRLGALVRATPDAALSEDVAHRDYTLKFLAHGVPLHNAYHAGQIGLLKKAIRIA